MRPNYALTARALRAKPVTAQSVGRRRLPAASSFAQAIVKAAARLPRPKKTAARSRKTAPPTGTPGVWQEIGPRRIPDGPTYGTNRIDVAGRVAAIAVDPNDPAHLLVGAAGGGIWESTIRARRGSRGPTRCRPLRLAPSLLIPKTPSRVFAGSGEGNFYFEPRRGRIQVDRRRHDLERRASSPFIGVGFFDLVVDPKTPSTLYAGTTSGFSKSTNSGASWSLKKSGKCWDISVHPQGGDVEILAAFATGLFVSGNGGGSFTPVALPSQPSAAWLRLGVDRVVDSPDVAYVFGAAGNDAFLWRRSGTTWKKQVLPAVNHDQNNYFPNKLEIGQAEYDWVCRRTAEQDRRGVCRGHRHVPWSAERHDVDMEQCHDAWPDSVHPDQHCLVFAPAGQDHLLRQ